MEGIINSIRNLFGTYGFHAAAVVLATIIVVNIVKRPLVRKAELLAEKTGVDKSVVTKNVTIIPVAVAFVIELTAALVAARFDFRSVDYGSVASSAVLYGALAIATYESVKKQLRAYAASVNEKNAGRDKTVGDRDAGTGFSDTVGEKPDAEVPATPADVGNEEQETEEEKPYFFANGD